MTELVRHAPDPGPITLEGLVEAMASAPPPLPPFAPEALAFFAALSDALMRHPQARAHPDLLALAYWLRRSELGRLKARFEAGTPPSTLRVPRGLAFHVPPANVDTMFVYSWVLSCLVGNRDVIRLSPRAHTPAIRVLLAALNALLDAPEHARMRARILVVGYGHDEAVSRALSAACDVRVLWGGDQAVNALRAFPLPPHAQELTFPDRFSLAALDAAAYEAADAATRDTLARGFYNDAYWFDQGGCASPRLVLWCGDRRTGEAASGDFYKRLAAVLAERAYVPAIGLALAKQLAACRAILDLPVTRHEAYGSALTVLTLEAIADVRAVRAGGGLFFQAFPATLETLAPHLTRRDQTLTHFGFAPETLGRFAALANGRGLDRLVPIGQALDFQAIWDGHDLMQALSRTVWVQPSPVRTPDPGPSPSQPQGESPMISPMAVVQTTDIGAGTRIGEFAVVRKGVRIGKNVTIHPHVVIEEGTTIGDNVEIYPGAYLGRTPKGVGAAARQITFEKRIVIGDHSAIGPGAVIYYDVTIGKNTIIGDAASIREQVAIGDFCIISRNVTMGYNVRVGDYTKIMDNTNVTGNSTIGEYVFISALVVMTNDRGIGKWGYEEERVQGPKIGDRVAVGAGANLLPGVNIGDGAIVAAGSVVGQDVPAGKMVAGFPARVIKDAEAEFAAPRRPGPAAAHTLQSPDA